MSPFFRDIDTSKKWVTPWHRHRRRYRNLPSSEIIKAGKFHYHSLLIHCTSVFSTIRSYFQLSPSWPAQIHSTELRTLNSRCASSLQAECSSCRVILMPAFDTFDFFFICCSLGSFLLAPPHSHTLSECSGAHLFRAMVYPRGHQPPEGRGPYPREKKQKAENYENNGWTPLHVGLCDKSKS